MPLYLYQLSHHTGRVDSDTTQVGIYIYLYRAICLYAIYTCTESYVCMLYIPIQGYMSVYYIYLYRVICLYTIYIPVQSHMSVYYIYLYRVICLYAMYTYTGSYGCMGITAQTGNMELSIAQVHLEVAAAW